MSGGSMPGARPVSGSPTPATGLMGNQHQAPVNWNAYAAQAANAPAQAMPNYGGAYNQMAQQLAGPYVQSPAPVVPSFLPSGYGQQRGNNR